MEWGYYRKEIAPNGNINAIRVLTLCVRCHISVFVLLAWVLLKHGNGFQKLRKLIISRNEKIIGAKHGIVLRLLLINKVLLRFGNFVKLIPSSGTCPEKMERTG